MSAEWIAVVLSLFGMLGSLVAAKWSRDDARRSNDAADRAEERAEEANTLRESMSKSLVKLAEKPEVGFKASRAVRNRRVIVTSTGTRTVTGLTIEPAPSWREGVQPATELEPGESFECLLGGQIVSIKIFCDQKPEGEWVEIPVPPLVR